MKRGVFGRHFVGLHAKVQFDLSLSFIPLSEQITGAVLHLILFLVELLFSTGKVGFP
jgi:hypothetical protein